jgi:GTP cyclohydrolase I
VQSQHDVRHLAIDKVGIKGIRHPVVVKDKSIGVQHTIASFNMYVYLPHDFKGTHMSRFVEILNQHGREISVESFESILRDMEAGGEVRPHRDELPLFRQQGRAGVRRTEPAGL